MAVRREVIQRLGPLDVRLLRGEDTELYGRCMAAGCRILYEPDAVAYHRITGDKLTMDYARRWHHWYGHYDAYLLPWKPLHLVTIMPLWRAADTGRCIGRWITVVLARRPWWERFRAELQVRQEASFWWHRLQLWPRWWLTVLTGRSRFERPAG